MPYSAYLKSQHWKKLRKRVLGRWLGYCEWCGGTATEVHHLTYARRGQEHLQDLVPLCVTCHRTTHQEDGTMR